MIAITNAAPADFVTVATTADGKLMTKVFFYDSDGRERAIHRVPYGTH